MDVVRRLEAAERFLDSQATILDATAFQESAHAIETTVIATIHGMALCPDDAIAINDKVAAMQGPCVALCAMCRAC